MFCSIHSLSQYQEIYQTIQLDFNRDESLSQQAKEFLRNRFMLKSERSPQEAFARAATAFATNPEHAQRLYDYASQGWMTFATPLLSNGGTSRGLPVSCFLNYVGDSRKELAAHYEENIWLSTEGGGIGGHWSDVRSKGQITSRGVETSGIIPFIKVSDSQVPAFHQGSTRRGSYAAYLDISHPEIEEFIEIRKPTGGDVNRRCLNLHHAVNIPHAFMEAVKAEKDWDLVDPATQEVVKQVSARQLWYKLLEMRVSTGEPYLHFIDTSNEYLPKPLKAKGLKIRGSNLCSEITLPTGPNYTAICCLSSPNVAFFDEWRDTLLIEDMVEMLDNALETFIQQSPPELKNAVTSAKEERSIGLGQTGFWTLIQKRRLSPYSKETRALNLEVSRYIYVHARKASVQLAQERGPAPMAEKGLRNAHLIAIAPNVSSSVMCNSSPSIEPYRANAYTHKTLDGFFLSTNPQLESVLEELGLNTSETWKSIMTNMGSVQHLDLSPEVKETFLTAVELDQKLLVELAADRQLYVCQAQSLNLFFAPESNKKTIHEAHWLAWEKGLKSLYYLRSEAIGRAELVGQQAERQVKLQPPEAGEECMVCAGG
jgi:ribonucleoside-diphosphate reductase alpha chain